MGAITFMCAMPVMKVLKTRSEKFDMYAMVSEANARGGGLDFQAPGAWAAKAQLR